MKVIFYCPIIRYLIVFCLLSFTATNSAYAQNKKSKNDSDCERKLKDAQKWYQEGKLEEVEQIETCLKNNKSLSREKRIEALQLLTESYLYTDRIGAADKSFKGLLRVNPLYEADSTKEEISHDLVYLSRTYSRRPIFSMYFGAGANFSLIEQLQNYGVDNTSGVADHEGYLSGISVGANFNMGFELPLIYNFDLATDITFGYRTYNFADSLYMSVTSANSAGATSSELGRAGAPLLYSTLTFKENQFWIDIPLMLRYNIGKFKFLMPYIYVGGAANFLLYANISGIERTTAKEVTGVGGKTAKTAGNPIDLTAHFDERTDQMMPSLRTTVNVSLVAGAGIKIRAGRNFIYADFRYTRMFLNNVDLTNRYANQDLIYKYGHVDNDFRTDNFALTVGFIKSFYVPRKKVENNPLIINRKYDKWLEKQRNSVKKETDEDLKRELNSVIKDMEKQKPGLIEDVQKGSQNGEKMLSDKQKQLDSIRNKEVKVEVKYE